MPKKIEPPQVAPSLFILNIEEDYGDLFDSIYVHLIESLASAYHVQHAHKPDEAKSYLSDPKNRPIAILIVDAGTTKPANVAVLDQVKSYVKTGGIAIFMATFSNFMEPNEMSQLWKNYWGLSWEFGDILSTDVQLNR